MFPSSVCICVQSVASILTQIDIQLYYASIHGQNLHFAWTPGSPRMSNSTASISQLAAELAGRLDGEIRFDEMTRGLYSTDASIYQISPVGVELPRTQADVRPALELP